MPWWNVCKSVWIALFFSAVLSFADENAKQDSVVNDGASLKINRESIDDILIRLNKNTNIYNIYEDSAMKQNKGDCMSEIDYIIEKQ